MNGCITLAEFLTMHDKKGDIFSVLWPFYDGFLDMNPGFLPFQQNVTIKLAINFAIKSAFYCHQNQQNAPATNCLLKALFCIQWCSLLPQGGPTRPFEKGNSKVPETANWWHPMTKIAPSVGRILNFQLQQSST